MSTIAFQCELEPYLGRLGTIPEGQKTIHQILNIKIQTHFKAILDKPSFVKEVYAVDDIEILRQLIIKKERERQTISNDLDVAARIGLVISETNEAIQLKVIIAVIQNENKENLQQKNKKKSQSNWKGRIKCFMKN